MFDDEWHQGHVAVGQAMGHIKTARVNRSVRTPEQERTPEQSLQRAAQSVGRAYRLFLMAGLTKAQAVERIVSLSQTFGSLE